METLEQINPHPRDKNIKLEPEDHVYEGPVSGLRSVSSWIKDRFEQFNSDKIAKRIQNGRNWNEENKYWGMSESEIKKQWSDNNQKSRDLGTSLHAEIEAFMNQGGSTNYDLLQLYFRHLYESEPDEVKVELGRPDWRYFLEFIIDHPSWIPYRSEWRVYHEEYKLAGSIDMVYFDAKTNGYIIVDWKRCKEITMQNPYGQTSTTPGLEYIPDTNFWHYTFQLNLYKIILGDKYGIKITRMLIVRCHPKASGYELYEVSDLTLILRSFLARL